MIKQSTIDELRSKMDIADIITPHVKLKKSGSGFIGICPFHNEKSGSFHVTPSKQIFKCFGCGAGGDAFKFIMLRENLSFIDAIIYLCNQYNITIEYDQAQQQETEERKTMRQQQLELTSWAQKKYEDVLFSLPDDAAAIKYMHNRGYSKERMRSWSMGFAPDDWKFLTTPCINMGKHGPAVECGLLYSKDGRTWDFFRNRIIIPIHDNNGVLIGLAGRVVPGGNEEQDKKLAKYLNPNESLIYSKAKTWYGLWQAQRSIKEEGYAYVVEGYMDVQSLHDAGIVNAVASCGTEIDEQQVRLLKRYTSHAVICYDGDEPGVKKQMKQIDLFLKHDFKVEVVELPDGKDPDEFIRTYEFKPEEVMHEEVEASAAH